MDDTVEEDQSLCGFLSIEQLNAFAEFTIAEAETKLADALELYDHVTSLESGIVLDYYVSAFSFSRENKFTRKQTDCMLYIMKAVLDNCKEGYLLDHNILALKGLLTQLLEPSENEQPPITVHEAKLISDYLLESFFQHYKLYQFFFSSPQELSIVHQGVSVDSLPPASLPFPSPLEEGMVESLYTKFVAKPKKDVTSEEKAPGKSQEMGEEDSMFQEGEAEGGVESSTPESDTNLLQSLDPEQIRSIVDTYTEQKLNEIKAEYKKKLKEKEMTVLNKLGRLNLK